MTIEETAALAGWHDANSLLLPMHCSTSFLAGADPKTAFAKGGLLDELKKALAERALNTELDQHYAGSEGNSRNGYGGKQRQAIKAAEPVTRLPAYDWFAHHWALWQATTAIGGKIVGCGVQVPRFEPTR